MLAGVCFAVGLLTAIPNEIQLQELVNKYRSLSSLEPLSLDPSLCKAAAGHANFMATNKVLSHFEKRDMPAFTGQDLSERAERVGWRDALSELVGYASTNLQDSVQAVFDSPCHRVRFLKPGKLQLGASASGTFVCLLIGGEAAPDVVVSPAPGQTEIPLSWHASSDFSGTKTGFGSLLTGYPIVFLDTHERSGSLTVQQVELRAGDGPPIAVNVREPNNDKHFRDAIAIIPERPLTPMTRYTVSVKVLLSDGKSVFKTWSFVTTADNSE